MFNTMESIGVSIVDKYFVFAKILNVKSLKWKLNLYHLEAEKQIKRKKKSTINLWLINEIETINWLTYPLIIWIYVGVINWFLSKSKVKSHFIRFF